MVEKLTMWTSRECNESSKTVEIIETENKGLSVAQNIIINNKKLSEFHLVLNPDIFVNKDCLVGLLIIFRKTITYPL